LTKPTPRQWRISRHPANYRFAFTIVHDADSAYSKRLEPLFDVFTQLGLRLTVSAFAFWATWARQGAIWNEWKNPDGTIPLHNPKSVPLCDPNELDFYRTLQSAGHEIALHSPSETSNTREEVIAAFSEFQTWFGHPIRVYVEHASRSNKETLSNEGAKEDSPHYCLDLLKTYAPWIWVDRIGALRQTNDHKEFELLPTDSLANSHAESVYGLPKTFRRTGRWNAPGGDGFLECYTPNAIHQLECDEGTALVYTHLDYGWLDPSTNAMRSDIRQRLESIASRPGWFAPASVILDRALAVSQVTIQESDRSIHLVNHGTQCIDDGLLIDADNSIRIPFGRLEPHSSRTIPLPTDSARI
jgi:hypothetical protein